MNVINWLRTRHITAPAALLFTGLLAQAPHAAAVFIRIAPHDAQWEVVTSFVGGWVYAIALESATAYFVWRSKRNWAFTFAAFSIAHNVAYYMPVAWEFDVYGATLSLRYVFSAILISMSLPIAIAAFSHVQAETPHAAPDAPRANDTTSRAAPAADTAPETASTDVPAPLTPAQRRAHIAEQEMYNAAQVAAQFGISLRAAQLDIAQVRKAMTQQSEAQP